MLKLRSKMKGCEWIAGVGLAVLCVGCGGSPVQTGSASYRVVNLLRGSSSVLATSDTGLDASVSYGAASGLQSIDASPQAMLVKDVAANLSLGTTALSPSTGGIYTVYAYGVENGSPAPVVTVVPETVSGKTVAAADGVRFGNFSTILNQPLDVYFTAVGDTTTKLSKISPVFSGVAYGSVSPYISYPNATSANVRVRFTPAGSPNNVLVDIASFHLIAGAGVSVYSTDLSSGTASLVGIEDPF